ncbi:MAG TPA: hypothetical protein GX707_17825 [Epulopiscium sp.]|nr:hypothetical protein [Candidatus Epulonipiscium sp.]
MKNKLITVTLSVLLFSIFVINILSPIKEVSYSERRKLAQFPKPSLNAIISGELMKDFENYTLDQFAFRNQFRSLKALFDFKILNKKDNNDIYVIGDNVFKMEYPLDVGSVYEMSEKMNKVYELYLKDMNVFYSIIPDKNYFRKDDQTHLIMDYEKLQEIMIENVENMTYIDIIDSLELDDYYKTDTHWKQEKLSKVVKTLSEQMEFEKDVNNIMYTQKTYNPFYGVYYGQSALNIEPDTLIYQTTDKMNQISVYNYENSAGEEMPTSIYDEKKLGKMDSYDVFLSGATPLLTIKNPGNKSGKELIIFRDSFGSSLAPLLIEEYSKLMLVDLRYISHEAIGDFIDFGDQDVLFLYSTLVINSSEIIQ